MRSPSSLTVSGALAPTRDSAADAPASLAEAYERYAPYVACIAQRLLGNAEEAKDLVQDVFLASEGQLRRLSSHGAAKAWFATLAVRMARRKLQRARLWRWFTPGSSAEELDVVDPAASPAQHALLRSVYRVLERLPVDERLAWTLRHVEGESLDRVAELCGCSLATAKRRVARAHLVLQEALSDG